MFWRFFGARGAQFRKPVQILLTFALLSTLLLQGAGTPALGAAVNEGGGPLSANNGDPAAATAPAELGVLTPISGSTLFLWYESANLVMAEWWNNPAAAGCMYASNPWPQAALAAQRAYVLAVRSVLRDEWNIGAYIRQNEPSGSQARIHGTETGCFNGHVDYPPHVHILYLFGNTSQGWQLLNIHDHINSQGQVYDTEVIPNICGQSNTYNQPAGQWLNVLDQSCSPIWQQEYTSNGDLLLRRSSSAPSYTVRIHSTGADLASVDVLLGNTVIYNASVTVYDPVHYQMTAQISDFRNALLTTETWQGNPSTGTALTNHTASGSPLTGGSAGWKLYLPVLLR